MKLGPKRAHHYAHRPGDDCSLRNPETALHLNTKYLLARKLRTADALSVLAQCAWVATGFRCIDDIEAVAAEGWDEVRVEPFVDPVRPDILLVMADTAILALEVRATHAVPDTKAEKLVDLDIPWVEVDAGGDWDHWEPSTPMPVIRHESKLASRFCATHAEAAHAQARPSAAPQTMGARRSPVLKRPHPDGERWRLRVVDCYPHQGSRVRKVFAVYCMAQESGAVRMRLVDDDQVDPFIVAELRASSRSNESLREIHDELHRHLKRTFERFDSPHGWLDPAELPNNPAGLYRHDFLRVKYCRDLNGAWNPSGSEADV